MTGVKCRALVVSHMICNSYMCCLLIWWWCMQVHSAPTNIEDDKHNKQGGIGEPVWSHGESYSLAYASGEGSVLETDSWTAVNNHGGLQVNHVTQNGEVIGYQVAGMTNCSQESYAYASGAWSANAEAYGLCNSTVLLDNPVTNEGVGK